MIPAGTSWNPNGIFQIFGLFCICKLIPSEVYWATDMRTGVCERPTVDEIGDHDADGAYDLEKTGDASTDVLWRALRDVGWSNAGDGSKPHPRHNSATVDVTQATTSAGNCL